MAQRSIGGLRSGSIAKATGVSADTIRHYEKLGILPKASRTESGYRVYPQIAIERVLAVQRALRIGFTLAELADVFKLRDGGGVPCQRVYQLAREKLRGIRSDIQDLKQTEKQMQSVLADWEDKIRRTSPGQKAHLLHSLTTAISGSRNVSRSFRRKRTS